jgi:hypothetical protein
MIPLWREELQQLAEIESVDGSAVSFYFQPSPPENRAHKGDAILVKDLVREARRDLERNGNSQHARSALDRIARLSDQLHTNGAHAKAIFACLEKGLWREFDLPAEIGKTQLVLNNRFHLQPFAAAVLQAPHCFVALVDREKARIYDLYMDDLSRREEILDEVPRRVRTAGFGGYDAGHVERHVDNVVMRHFKRVAERLREISTKGEMDVLIVGCRNEIWPELQPHLHSYVKQIMIGRFDADPATVDHTAIKEAAQRILSEHGQTERAALIRDVMGEAQRDGRGSLGLRRVITSLERGEVQTIVMGENFNARAMECKHCGHLDTRMVSSCAICGQGTKELEDVAGALVGHALRRRAEIVYVGFDPEFESRGNIGALLRFRSDQSTPDKLTG